MVLTIRYLLLVSMVTSVGSQEKSAAADSNHVCLIVPASVEDCYRSYTDKPISERAAQVACLQQLLWNFEPVHNLTLNDLQFFRGLRGAGPHPNSTYISSTALPPSGYRVRREYRTLSDGEKQRFHNAMNKLYEEGVLGRFAELYAEASNFHQLGASFLPWNRVFLAMFEEALREVDRHVFLPFWDSSIDAAMDNPVNSALWTPAFLGPGTGRVLHGLGGDWVTHQGHLERDYGKKSRLVSKDQVRAIMGRCNMKEISRPTAQPEFDLELIAGGPAAWVGGDMAFPVTAAYDPVFYIHLAYIDYIWQLFRVRQDTRCGVSAASDYPEVPEGDSHHPEAPMTGFDWLTNRDGIQNYWTDNWYRYQTHPVCPDCCSTCRAPSPMFCDNRINVCVARSRRVFPFATSPATIPTREEFLEASELLALLPITPPRNRGIEFDHPPADGRTLATANIDAARASVTAPVPRVRVAPRPIQVPGQHHHHSHSTDPRGSFTGGRTAPVSHGRQDGRSRGEFSGTGVQRRSASSASFSERAGMRTGTSVPRRDARTGRVMGQGGSRRDGRFGSAPRVELSPFIRRRSGRSGRSRTGFHSDRTGLHSDRTGLHSDRTGLHSDRTGLHRGRTDQHMARTDLHSDRGRTRRGSTDRQVFTRHRQGAMPRRRVLDSESGRGEGRRRVGSGRMSRDRILGRTPRGGILRPDTASTGSSAAMRGALFVPRARPAMVDLPRTFVPRTPVSFPPASLAAVTFPPAVGTFPPYRTFR